MRCRECGTTGGRYEDPRWPPIEQGECLCAGCFEMAAEQRIEECQAEITELTQQVGAIKARRKKPKPRPQEGRDAIMQALKDYGHTNVWFALMRYAGEIQICVFNYKWRRRAGFYHMRDGLAYRVAMMPLRKPYPVGTEESLPLCEGQATQLFRLNDKIGRSWLSLDDIVLRNGCRV